MRRVVALQESRLTDLSLLEAEVSGKLSRASVIRLEPREAGAQVKGGTVLLRGISNIQTAARRAMEGQDLRIVVNEDSEDHVTTTIRYMSQKPRSARIIFATRDEKQEGFASSRLEIGGYTYEARVFHGEVPTFVLAGRQCLLFTYTTQHRRRKPLSPVSSRTVVSECIAVEDPKFVAQMGGAYESFWNASE